MAGDGFAWLQQVPDRGWRYPDEISEPGAGSVVECEHGMVIYMGALTYVIGPLKVMGSKGSTDGTNYYGTN